jgi:hypothetical protein
MRSIRLAKEIEKENARMKKILWVGEAPYLNTGYAVYAKNVLSYLASLGKYEIVQLGIYAVEGDVKNNQFPWKIVPNVPQKDSPKYAEYDSSDLNQFGAWRFEQLCKEFKPDVVCNIADLWMF